MGTSHLVRARPVQLLALVALLGCDSGREVVPEDAFDVPEGCNPIAAEHDCLLPYPSDVFLAEGFDTPTTRRVLVPVPARPRTSSGQAVDLTVPHRADGFSVGSQILAVFPGGVDDASLATAGRDPALSLAADSPTVLIDAATGERVVHMAELDPRASDDARRALVLRPLVRLAHEQRYIVAVRGLVDRSGSPVAVPEGFGRLRDGRIPAESVLEPLSAHYESSVFPLLEAAGIARGELQLAWDFTTESEQNVTADMLAVRADVLDRFGQSAPEIEVVAVQDDVDSDVFRRIDAIVRVPMYLQSEEPLAPLQRDAAGVPLAAGVLEVPFVVAIPRSVAEAAPGSPPARLVQFGHGFFGTREEVMSVAGYLGTPLSAVVIGTEFWGMSDAERIPVGNRLVTDPDTAMLFTDGVHQGMANFIALELAARGPLAALPEMQIDGAVVYDPSEIYYYGISGGGILGGTFMALSPTIERGATSVGGANYSFIAFRSASFGTFLLIIQGVVPDPLDQQKLVAMMQTGFDRIDPLTYAPQVLAPSYPDTPAQRKVLLHAGIGDAAVTAFSAQLHARALGIAHLQPAPRPIYGLELAQSPYDGSAIVEFDFGIDPLPDLHAMVGPSNEVHDGVRRLTAANEQLDRFFRPDGRIENTCDGPCDPE